MSFEVSADAYARFMGRYSEPLGALFADAAGVRAGRRALDVGCGPGALTAHLVARLGAAQVAAVDPSTSFLAATRSAFPGVDVHEGFAERLPFEDDSFDVALAQLVVHFMSDPVLGLHEMARVTRPGGGVAACVWDLAGERAPISLLWQVARTLDPDLRDESGLPGVREGDLGSLFERAGLADVEVSELTVHTTYSTFLEWWEPYTYGIGPAGLYVATRSPSGLAALREACREALPDGDFDVGATAWCAVGRA